MTSVERGDNNEKPNRASSPSPARSEHAWPIGVHYARAAHIKFAFCCLFSSSTRRHESLYLAHPAHPALTERQAPTVGQAEPQPRQRQRIAIRVTLRTRQAEPAVPAVPALPVLAAVTEELAATPPRPPPRAQPMALAMVSLPRLPQAAQAAQAAQAFGSSGSVRRLRRQCDLECNSDQRPQRVSLLHCQWRSRWHGSCPDNCNGGNGGSANAQASGIAREQVTVSAIATGGDRRCRQLWSGGSVVMAALPPYRAAALVRQFLAVRQPAALSPYQVLRLVVTAAAATGVDGQGASVSLISNGGVNDAIGGATSGTLNLTQTAIGGSGGTGFNGSSGGNATSILIGTNPFGASTYNLTANATGGNGNLFWRSWR